MSSLLRQNAKQRLLDKTYEQYRKPGCNLGMKRDQIKTLHKAKGQSLGAVEKTRNLSTFKQQFTYETLIAMAIRNSPNKALTVAEIHANIAEIYPYFKTFPGSLKASIVRTLSTRNCFVRLGEPCQNYWTFTNLGRSMNTEEKSLDQNRQIGNDFSAKKKCSEAAVSRSSNSHKQSTTRKVSKPSHNPKTTHNSWSAWSQSKQAAYSAYSQAAIQVTAHSQARISTTPLHSQPASGLDVATSTVHSQANSRHAELSHYDLLRRNIHNSPLYPRVPVITPPPQQRRPEESGLKIDRVFSMNPQCSSMYQTAMQPCLQAEELLRSKIIPYHPCTLWGSQLTPNSPKLSSFVSEDKERYEDA
ncbi:protein fork head-like [Dendronephthya gigantea]|uniref:protein fork head-like n=1 Tax=Dendronephthya gigantea TaxID=151771 RepID=UPI00106C53B5|nr:protein fork head-like [Dendronephthya gigantea]